MSSTVWCASMCRSPFAFDRRGRACRAARPGRACGRGTARRSRARARPLPSRLSSTAICVSAVLRSTRGACGAAASVGVHGRRSSAASSGVVLGGRADGDAQAVRGQRMIAVQVLDQDAGVAQRARTSAFASGTRTSTKFVSVGKTTTSASRGERAAAGARARRGSSPPAPRARRPPPRISGAAACVSAFTLYGGRTLSISRDPRRMRRPHSRGAVPPARSSRRCADDEVRRTRARAAGTSRRRTRSRPRRRRRAPAPRRGCARSPRGANRLPVGLFGYASQTSAGRSRSIAVEHRVDVEREIGAQRDADVARRSAYSAFSRYMTNDGSGARTQAPGAAIDGREHLDQLVRAVAEHERRAPSGSGERLRKRRLDRVAGAVRIAVDRHVGDARARARSRSAGGSGNGFSIASSLISPCALCVTLA